MYQGSEAVRLDVSEGALAQRSPRRSFEVVEGRGLDARARQGLSPAFVRRAKIAVAVVVAVMALAVVRLGMFAATVSVLSDNASMRTELKSARATQDELRVERSVLSSSSRIERIATKAYGMVPAPSAEQMSAGATQSADEAAQSGADAADASTDASSAEKGADSRGESAQGASGSQDTGSSASQDRGAQATDEATSSALQNSASSAGDGSAAGSNAADVDSLS